MNMEVLRLILGVAFCCAVATCAAQRPDLELYSQHDVDMLDTLYPDGLTSFSGHLAIGSDRFGPGSPDSLNITDLSPLRRLKRVGALTISRNYQLRSLEALDSLEYIAAWLIVKDCPLLEDVDIFQDVAYSRHLSRIEFSDLPLVPRVWLDSLPSIRSFAGGFYLTDLPHADSLRFPRLDTAGQFILRNLGVHHLNRTNLPASSAALRIWDMPRLKTVKLHSPWYDTTTAGKSGNDYNIADVNFSNCDSLHTISKSTTLGYARVAFHNLPALPTLDSVFQSAYFYRRNRPDSARYYPYFGYGFTGMHGLDSIYIGYPNLPNETLSLGLRGANKLRSIESNSTNFITNIQVRDTPQMDSIYRLSDRTGSLELTLERTGLSNIPDFDKPIHLSYLVLKDNARLEQIGFVHQPTACPVRLSFRRNPKLTRVSDMSACINADGSTNISGVGVEIVDNPNLLEFEWIPNYHHLKNFWFAGKLQLGFDQYASFDYGDRPIYVEPQGDVVISGFDSLRHAQIMLSLRGRTYLHPFPNLKANTEWHDPSNPRSSMDVQLFLGASAEVIMPEGTPFPAYDSISLVEQTAEFPSPLIRDSLYNYMLDREPKHYVDLTFPSARHALGGYQVRGVTMQDTLLLPWHHRVDNPPGVYSDGTTFERVALNYQRIPGLQIIPPGLDSALASGGLFLSGNNDLTDCTGLCDYLRNGIFADKPLWFRMNGTPGVGSNGSLQCSDLAELLRVCDSLATPTQQAPADDPLAYRVWPNPTAGQLQLDLAQADPAATVVYLYDRTGRLLREWPLASGEQSPSYDITDLANGVYILSIRGFRGAKLVYKQ